MRGGYAIRQCLCMFRKGRPLSPWLQFGLHFGVVLETKIVTILLFGRLCRENRPSKSLTVFAMISDHVKLGGAAKGGLARPEGGYSPGTPHRIS